MEKRKRSSWIALGFSGLATLLLVARVVVSPSGWAVGLLSVVCGVIVVLLVVVIVVPIYTRRIGAMERLAGPDCWTAHCVVPTTRAWLAILADETEVRIVDRRGHVRHRWLWTELAGVECARIPIGVVHQNGIYLQLLHGDPFGVLLPSRNTLSYPRDLAESARDEISKRLDIARRST